MDGYWIRALDDAERAEARARAMRQRFGVAAEDRCDSELKSFAAADPRRRRVEDVRRALRWT
jgi:hypothetical protein